MHHTYTCFFFYLIEAERRIYATVQTAIIDSDNGLSPTRRQAIIWPNADLQSIGPWGINFNEISMEVRTFPFKKMRFENIAIVLS